MTIKDIVEEASIDAFLRKTPYEIAPIILRALLEILRHEYDDIVDPGARSTIFALSVRIEKEITA